MENIDKIENLKFIISRYDNYIESSHTKSNVYLSLNTAVFAGVITLISTLKIETLNTFLTYTLLVIAFLNVLSIIIILGAIKPNLLSGKKSIIFFGDVANSNIDDFLDKIQKIKNEKFVIDLSNQTHYLAKIVTEKFEKINWVGNIIKLEFLILLVWLVIFINK